MSDLYPHNRVDQLESDLAAALEREKKAISELEEYRIGLFNSLAWKTLKSERDQQRERADAAENERDTAKRQAAIQSEACAAWQAKATAAEKRELALAGRAEAFRLALESLVQQFTQKGRRGA